MDLSSVAVLCEIALVCRVWFEIIHINRDYSSLRKAWRAGDTYITYRRYKYREESERTCQCSIKVFFYVHHPVMCVDDYHLNLPLRNALYLRVHLVVQYHRCTVILCTSTPLRRCETNVSTTRSVVRSCCTAMLGLTGLPKLWTGKL